MRNKDKWIPTRIKLDKDNNIIPNEKNLKKEIYIPVTLECEVMNKIEKKYLKGKLLDLGCGKVPYYAWYKDNIDENICLDWIKNDYVDIVHDISKNFPFNDGEFDSILSTFVLEHIYNPHNMLKECYRVLCKDGHLIISSDFSYWEHDFPHDYFRYSEYFFLRTATELGFEVCELHPLGDGFCSIFDIATKMCTYRPNSVFFKMLYKILKNFFFYFHVKKKKSMFSKQPLGYICVMRKI